MEANGAVFLPAAGCRGYTQGGTVTSVEGVDRFFCYWTTTKHDVPSYIGMGSAYYIYIASSYYSEHETHTSLSYGHTVRLVKDVN